MKCSRSCCPQVATMYPVISFASELDPEGSRAQMRFPLPVCDQHASTDPDAYINDAGWEQIRAAIIAAGRAEPDRSSVRIEFEVIQ